MHKHQQLLEPQESHPNHNVGFLQPCLRMLQQYLKLQVLRRLKELCPQSQVRRHQPAVAVMTRNVLWCCCIWLGFFGSNPATETGQRWSKRGYSSDYKGIWEKQFNCARWYCACLDLPMTPSPFCYLQAAASQPKKPESEVKELAGYRFEPDTYQSICELI